MKRWITAFFMTWGQFCAIPCPYKKWDNGLRAQTLVCLPVIGLFIGAIWAAAAYLLREVGCPVILTAAILTVLPYLLSGFIHLDGFMDCCDAILSRRDLPERQRILKDPATGAFAVICLCIVILLSFAALCGAAGKNPGSLALIPVVSRCCSALAVQKLRPIGHSSYAGIFSKGAARGHALAVVIMLAAAVVLPSVYFFPLGLCAPATALGSLCALVYGYRQLGGMSGDISGYAITVGELCGIIVFAIL